MSKYTPGPWHTDEPYYIYVWGPDRQMVADLPAPGDEEAYLARMRGVGRGATEDEQRANARLIAAAPELLEALKTMASALNTARLIMKEQDTRDLAKALVDDARAVIANAEGRS